MRCIAVVDAEGVGASEIDAELERLAAADVVLRSLAEIDARVWRVVDAPDG